LKHYIQWHPKILPELIRDLKALVDGKYNEADRAIVGQGNYRLRKSHERHRMSFPDWLAMTEVQRQHKRDQCFKLATRTITSTSTDGSISFVVNPNGSRKLNARRRPCAGRTTSIKKVPKSSNSSINHANGKLKVRMSSQKQGI
jgi:hypothetical protein